MSLIYFRFIFILEYVIISDEIKYYTMVLKATEELDAGYCNCLNKKYVSPYLKVKTLDGYHLKVLQVKEISAKKFNTKEKFIAYVIAQFNYKKAMRSKKVSYLSQRCHNRKVFILSGTYKFGVFMMLYIDGMPFLNGRVTNPDKEYLKTIAN